MTRPTDELSRPRQGRAGTAVAAAVAVLLGSFALEPVFATLGWLPPITLAVLAVGLGGVVLRAGAQHLGDRVPRLAAPARVLVPVGQLLLVLVVLTMVFASTDAWAGLVPTPTSLGDLAGLLADGTDEIREQGTPALPLTGLIALTTVFVALVALAVDLLAVPARQPALGGLGLLVLYCVPVSTITGDVALISFAAPAAGFAVLLWADQRGRLVEGARAGSGSALGTGTLPALRTGVVALVAGLLLPVLVPTLSEGSLAAGLGGSGTGNGLGTALDPVAEMAGQLNRPEAIDLFRLDASVPDPGYLRSVALDEYTADRGWGLTNLNGQESIADDATLAPLTGGQTARPVLATVTVLEHDDVFMPVLYSPLSVQLEDGDAEDWRFDADARTVFGRDTTTAGLTYRLSAQQPEPSVEQLDAAPDSPADADAMERYTALPDLDPTVTALADELTDPGQAPYERALAIQQYFADRDNGFVYSLSTTPGTTGDRLVDFLRLKRGYCEQYAGAMAVLVRAAGVPARVVLGYTPGQEQEDGTRLVTTDDAHAWVEAWFSGLGWIPFDPTPIAANRAVDLPWAPRTEATDDTAVDPVTPQVEAPVPAAPTAELDRDDEPVPTAAPLTQPTRDLTPWLTGAAGALLLLGVAALPWAARRRQRSARLADGGPGALWDELLATANDLHVEVPGTTTSRQLARQLAERLSGAEPAAVAAVRTLALAQERAVYGPPATAGDRDPALAAALQTVRRAMLRSVSRSQRLRAVVWPASTVGTAARWLAARTPGRPRPA
ncbi:transglutaminaseTgpA domain-containing protein [Modestobacter sp. SSW1-42]|uniref:transglutaminase family protein n=1 Tax=Modestobacter sp. SSW1-42 TaxID=596372 RepID=UPI003985F796